MNVILRNIIPKQSFCETLETRKYKYDMEIKMLQNLGETATNNSVQIKSGNYLQSTETQKSKTNKLYKNIFKKRVIC